MAPALRDIINHSFFMVTRRVIHMFRPTFILIHLIYIVSLSIIGSVILYPEKDTRYIDSLFLSVAACTQSGLNTIDLNLLKTYQQIVLYLLPMVSNPIFINSLIVFVRLHAFQVRFKGIQRESREWSRLRRAQTLENKRRESEEKDMNGRPFTSRRPSMGGMSSGVPLSDYQRFSSGRRGSATGNMYTPTKEHTDLNANSEESTESTATEANHKSAEPDLSHPPRPIEERDIRFAGIGDSNDRVNSYEEIDPRTSLDSPKSEKPVANETQNNKDIRFGDLPHPNHDDGDGDFPLLSRRMSTDLSSGPALVIKGPREQELDGDHNVVRASNARSRRGMRRHSQPRDCEAPITFFHGRDTSDSDHDSSDSGDDARLRHTQSNIEPNANVQQFSSTSAKFGKRCNTIEAPEGSRGRDMSIPWSRSLSFGVPGFVKRSMTENSDMSGRSRQLRRMSSAPYLSYQPTVGRNSAFINLTVEEKAELGGVEYAALKVLAYVLIIYFIGLNILSLLLTMIWVMCKSNYKAIIRADGVHPVWWGIFTGASTFNDLGFSLLPDSFMPFYTAVYLLLISSFFIIVGNTGFPVALRFAIWILFKLCPEGTSRKESYGFLLDHPRRCFTLMFPSAATWWLLFIVFALNAADLILFIILDFGLDKLSYIPRGDRVMSGLFQAVCTRTAGFTIFNLGELHPGIQVSYMVMMYISVMPIAISVRRTNVYEERSLGIYVPEEEDASEQKSYIAQHLRRQLSFDLWYIFGGLFILAIAEGGKIRDGNMNVFSCLFEIVSAYGTVGLSLGFPGINASLSAEFSTIGKLVIIAMMIRGRHRGLPYNIDRAVMLPSENLIKDDQEVAASHRRRSNFSRTMSSGRPNLRAGRVASTAVED